jgi:DNA-directed RNA polymerase subunit RPC12/RpoP
MMVQKNCTFFKMLRYVTLTTDQKVKIFQLLEILFADVDCMKCGAKRLLKFRWKNNFFIFKRKVMNMGSQLMQRS